MTKFERQSGFSLVEMIIVVAVIGVLVTMAVPQFYGYWAEREIIRIASGLGADIRWLQQMAVNDDTAANYNITLSGTGYAVKKGATVLKTMTFPGYAITGGTVTYNAVDLTANAANTITVTKTGAPGQYIHIAPETGRVRLSGSAAKQTGE